MKIPELLLYASITASLATAGLSAVAGSAERLKNEGVKYYQNYNELLNCIDEKSEKIDITRLENEIDKIIEENTVEP